MVARRERLALLPLLVVGLAASLSACSLCWPRGGQPGVCLDEVDDDDSSTADDDDDSATPDDDDSGADDDDDSNTPDDDDSSAPFVCDGDWDSPLLLAHGVTLECIPPAVFQMGSLDEEPGRDDDEQVHHVQLTRPLLVATIEVTRALYVEVTARDPFGCGGDCGGLPAGGLTWQEAVLFCNALSARELDTTPYVQLGANTVWSPEVDAYRLPTESEWEYAARGGENGGPYAGSDDAVQVGWCDGDAPQLGGQLAPNGFGLFDMSGNLSEWVWDRYGGYPDGAFDAPAVDPSGAGEAAELRVHRGGSFAGPLDSCRVADRAAAGPRARAEARGLRVVRTLPAALP